MTASNGFPSLTTAGQGLFNGPSSTGMVQGQADPDPSYRNWLRAGIVAQSETIPMWGGIGVYSYISPISATGPRKVLGHSLGRATALTGAAALVGFSVSDQAHNMLNSPTNTAPSAGSGQSINWYPLGSRARIAVACDSALVNLRGGELNQLVSWDFAAQMLVPYSAAYTGATVTNAVWANTNGGQTTFTLGTAIPALVAGSDVDISNVVSTGGSGVGFNGTFIVVSNTGTTLVVAQPLATSPGTFAGAGTIAGGGGALPVTVLEVQPTGCMTIQNLAGVRTYNYNGSCAMIQLTGGTVA